MFDFDVFVVSELKALCAELGVTVGNSVPKSEYIEAMNKYFQAPDVANKLMGLNRDNLQKVARRLSLPASGTKRELTDAILAKVNPQSEPIMVEPDSEHGIAEVDSTPDSVDPDPAIPNPEVTDEDDPSPMVRRLRTALIVAGILAVIAAALAIVLASRPVDLSPIQASIGQVSTKVGALGQSITGLSDRVSALEQEDSVVEDPAIEAETPADPVEEFEDEMVSEDSATDVVASALPESLQTNACNGIGRQAYEVEEVIKPLEKPWEWVWIDSQKWVTDHKQLPFKDCAILAQRPNSWIIVDADYSGTVNGYAEHAVTIYFLPDGQPQRDIYVFYGQYHVLEGSAPIEDVITLAKTIASHTGSSNRTDINFVIAEKPAK